jgi:DNA-binding CsgD family transcriptional regulator
MALESRWASQTAARMQPDQCPELAVLARRLSAAISGGLSVSPPVLRRNNAWGEFVLRAYPLEAKPDEVSKGIVGLTIERREPRSLALWRKVEGLPLSRREKQVSILLARGQDTTNIAQALGIREHTVISHRRNLYNKLGVDNRLALIERLHVS